MSWLGAILLSLFTSLALAGPAIIPGPPNYVIQQLNYTHITGTTTTNIKTGSGVLHNVCINNPNNTGTITINDGANTVGIITMSASTIGCFNYDVVFLTSLSIVTATAAGDLTITWY